MQGRALKGAPNHWLRSPVARESVTKPREREAETRSHLHNLNQSLPPRSPRLCVKTSSSSFDIIRVIHGKPFLSSQPNWSKYVENINMYIDKV
jgi:hypothetical protein